MPAKQRDDAQSASNADESPERGITIEQFVGYLDKVSLLLRPISKQADGVKERYCDGKNYDPVDGFDGVSWKPAFFAGKPAVKLMFKIPKGVSRDNQYISEPKEFVCQSPLEAQVLQELVSNDPDRGMFYKSLRYEWHTTRLSEVNHHDAGLFNFGIDYSLYIQNRSNKEFFAGFESQTILSIAVYYGNLSRGRMGAFNGKWSRNRDGEKFNEYCVRVGLSYPITSYKGSFDDETKSPLKGKKPSNVDQAAIMMLDFFPEEFIFETDISYFMYKSTGQRFHLFEHLGEIFVVPDTTRKYDDLPAIRAMTQEVVRYIQVAYGWQPDSILHQAKKTPQAVKRSRQVPAAVQTPLSQNAKKICDLLPSLREEDFVSILARGWSIEGVKKQDPIIPVKIK